MLHCPLYICLCLVCTNNIQRRFLYKRTKTVRTFMQCTTKRRIVTIQPIGSIILNFFLKMKLFYLLSLLFCITSVMGMPQKVALTPLASEEDYGTMRGSALQNFGSIRDRYPPIYVLGPYHNEDRQNPKLNTIRAYFNTINADSITLRKLLLSKLAAQCANQTKSLANHICNHVMDNDYDHIYFTVSPEIQLTNDFSKIKKNFDEIDKTSASFSTLNQLI